MASLRPADAIVLYKKAYDLSPDPALLYNIGKALEALEDYPGALEQFERFSREAGPDLKARVPRLDQLIADTRAKVSTLVLTCEAPHARLLLRGKDAGELPSQGSLTLRVNAGSAPIEVSAEGYVSYKKTVDLPRGGTLEIDAKLISKSSAGVLAIATTPEGADVLLDDETLGKAPVEATVPAGTHSIVARHRGYDDTKTSVVVLAGEHKSVSVTLEQGVPITARWWFWTGIGVVVLGGVVLTYAALTERAADTGSIAPGKATAPLVRF